MSRKLQDVKNKHVGRCEILCMLKCYVNVKNSFFLFFFSAVDMMTQLVKIFEDNYPERLKKAYVINGM